MVATAIGRNGPKGDQTNEGINADDQEPQDTSIKPSTMKELMMSNPAMTPSLPMMSSPPEVMDDQMDKLTAKLSVVIKKLVNMIM